MPPCPTSQHTVFDGADPARNATDVPVGDERQLNPLSIEYSTLPGIAARQR